VEQNSKVFALDAELAADLIPVTFVKKDGFEERSVSNRHTKEDLPDFDLDLAGSRNAVGVGVGRGQLAGALFIERFAA